MGGVVVQNQVDRQVFGHLTVDGLEELQPFLMPVPRHALADDHAGQHVQRGEQGGRAMAFVVVGLLLGYALAQRQNRLGPIQGLDLGFLVDADYNRARGLSRPGARCRDCSRSVSGRSPNPACGFHRTGLSTVPAVRAWLCRVHGLGMVLPR